MSTSDQLRTYAEMLAASEFIGYGEKLESGSLSSATGTNRIAQRLARSIDALLDVLQTDRNMVIAGGGTLAWDHVSGSFTRTADLTLKMLNELGGANNNVIASATAITLASAGNIAYCVLDRETNGANPTIGISANMLAFVTLVTGNTDRLDYQLLAYRDANGLVLWDGRRILTGESLTANGFTDTQYGQQSELTLVHTNQKENLQFLLHGGGFITWDETAELLTWDAQLVLSFPAYAGNNRIPAGNATVAAGEFLVLTLTRAPGSAVDVSGTLSAVADGSVSLGDNVFVLAYHDAVDGRIYLWDGTALSDGDRRRLGGVSSGVEFMYRAYGDATQVYDLTEGGTYPERDYKVGDGSLMVYMNGQKVKGSDAYWSGSYPSGSLVGSLDDGDRYLEVDEGSSTGSKIVFLADGQAVSEPAYHPAATHAIPYSWPQTNDWLEAFVGLQGEGPSPVDSVGIQGLGGATLDGDVKIESGSGVSLAYDYGNNSIVITATVAAGVASIEVDGGSQGAQTGALSFHQNAGINLDDSIPGEIHIGLSAQLSHLSDVDSDLAAALTGAEDPDATNIMATLKQTSRLEGFDVIKTKTNTRIRVGYGKAVIGGVTYISDSTTSLINVDTTDMYGSDVLTASTWHYVYITAGASPGGRPEGELSLTAPVDGKHPSDSSYLFLTSVYVNAVSKFTLFTKIGSQVHIYTQGSELSSPTTLSLGSQETVTPVPGTDIPDSGVAAVRVLMKLHASTSGDIEMRYGQEATSYRMHTMNLVAGRYYTHEFEIGLSDSGDWIWELEDPGSGGEFDSFEGVWLTGYVEGRYSTNTSLWTA